MPTSPRQDPPHGRVVTLAAYPPSLSVLHEMTTMIEDLARARTRRSGKVDQKKRRKNILAGDGTLAHAPAVRRTQGRSTFSPDMSLLSCDVPDTLSQMLSLFYFIFIIHLTLDVLNFFFLFYHIFHKVILSRKVIQNIENNLTQNLSNLKD